MTHDTANMAIECREGFTIVESNRPSSRTDTRERSPIVMRLEHGQTTRQIWQRSSSLPSPSAEDLLRWASFLATLSGSRVGRVTNDTWNRIAATYPGTALPLVLPRDDGALRLDWSNERYRFDVDILTDGGLEWFFRDRETGECAGTEDEPARAMPDEALTYLRRFA